VSLTLGTEKKIIESIFWYAVFGSAVKALHDKFIQKETTPAANRPVFQSIPEYAVFLPAPETADNEVVLRHAIRFAC